MLPDTDRLLGTVEQVLKAGEGSYKRGKRHHVGARFQSWCANVLNWRASGIIWRRRVRISIRLRERRPRRSCAATPASCAPPFPTCSITP